jgi:hypothetical protein
VTRYALTVRRDGRTLVALAGLAADDLVAVRRGARWAFAEAETVITITGAATLREVRRGGKWRRAA